MMTNATTPLSERQRGFSEAFQQFDALRAKWPKAFPDKSHEVRPLASGAKQAAVDARVGMQATGAPSYGPGRCGRPIAERFFATRRGSISTARRARKWSTTKRARWRRSASNKSPRVGRKTLRSCARGPRRAPGRRRGRPHWRRFPTRSQKPPRRPTRQDRASSMSLVRPKWKLR